MRAPTSSGGTTFGVGSNGQILKSNGTSIYWAADNDSHYATHMYVNATAGGATSNANTANTTTYLHLYDNTTKRETVQIKGSGTTSVSSTGGVITINSADSKTGTVTSVQVQATSPVTSSTSTAQTGSLNTTIALADNYGDTKNPYASKTKNTVLAAGATANSVPSFRALVAADIPSLSASKITSGTFDAARIPTLSITDKTSGTLTVARGGTGQTSIANIQAGKDGDGYTISSTYLKLFGGTMTGTLKTNSNIVQTAGYICGTDESYLHHGIKLGHSITDAEMNFYEVGGVFNFYKSVNGTNTPLLQIKDGTSNAPLRIDNGGTGATTAADARANLELTPSTLQMIATGIYITKIGNLAIIECIGSIETVLPPATWVTIGSLPGGYGPLYNFFGTLLNGGGGNQDGIIQIRDTGVIQYYNSGATQTTVLWGSIAFPISNN